MSEVLPTTVIPTNRVVENPMSVGTPQTIHGAKCCGAKTKRGRPCTQKAMPNGRCKLHGGLTPSGIASASWKHGRYSRYMPKDLKKKYAQAASDPELLNLSEDLSLLTTRVAELLERMGDNPPPPWSKAQLLFGKLKSTLVGEEDFTKQLEELGSLLDSGADRAKVQERCWREVRGLIQEKTKTASAEWKRLNEMKGVVAVGEVLAFAQAFLEAAKEVIKDRNTLRELHRRTLVLLPRDGGKGDNRGSDNGEEG